VIGKWARGEKLLALFLLVGMALQAAHDAGADFQGVALRYYGQAFQAFLHVKSDP